MGRGTHAKNIRQADGDSTRIRIYVSPGDAAGIGPAVALHALAAYDRHGVDFTLTGPASVWRFWASALGLTKTFDKWVSDGRVVLAGKTSVKPRPSWLKGIPDAESASVALMGLEDATAAAREGQAHAIVTGPIAKANMQNVGFRFVGHTEYFADAFGVSSTVMAFVGKRFRIALMSAHLPLADAIRAATPARLREVIRIAHAEMPLLTGTSLNFWVCGMNPHAGEGGLLGAEESGWMGATVDGMRSEGLPVDGPFVPDAVFRAAMDRPDVCVVAQYHDQGLIPLKLVDFDDAVNVTLGLPVVRTSPDHGTAFDIVAKGTARHDSMLAAIRLAAQAAVARRAASARR